jgi:hypothetical protein
MAEGVGTVQQDLDTDNRNDKPRLTIRQLREAAQKENQAKERARANRASDQSQQKSAPPPQKKKQSVFGSLFQVREPTQIALNQVAAQMIAQHGSTSATKVPNVRLEKMPDFVPKVNSKWDGIPENLKQKEKREKEKEKQRMKRESFFTLDSKSASDVAQRPKHSRASSSRTESSFGAYANSSGSQGASSRTRFYANSVNSSGDLASQQRSENMSFVPPLSPYSAPESILEEDPRSLPVSEAAETGLPSHETVVEPDSLKLFVADPELLSRHDSTKPHTSVLCDTGNQSMSPLTPSSHHKRQNLSALSPSGPEARATRSRPQELTLQAALLSTASSPLPSPSLRKQPSHTAVTEAFLAGEAQELVLDDNEESSGKRPPRWSQIRVQQDLEKRPDSSRARLGLRASMLVTEDLVSWDSLSMHESLPSSPKVDQPPPNAKTLFHKPFGKFAR